MLLNISSTGEITPQELWWNFNKYQIRGATKDKVTDLFNLIDFDGGGSVDYDEFIVICISTAIMLMEQTIKNMFDYFCPDESGYITLRNLIKRVG